MKSLFAVRDNFLNPFLGYWQEWTEPQSDGMFQFYMDTGNLPLTHWAPMPELPDSPEKEKSDSPIDEAFTEYEDGWSEKVMVDLEMELSKPPATQWEPMSTIPDDTLVMVITNKKVRCYGGWLEHDVTATVKEGNRWYFSAPDSAPDPTEFIAWMPINPPPENWPRWTPKGTGQ